VTRWGDDHPTRPPRLSERAWQDQVLKLAQLTGWLVHHCRPAMTAGGRYATPIQGDAGFPDLVLCRDERVLFVELKTDTGQVTPDQLRWTAALAGAAADIRIWRPRDFDSVRAELTYRPTDLDGPTVDIPTHGRL